MTALLDRFITEARAAGAVVHRDRSSLPAADAVTRPRWLIADSGTAVELYRPGDDRTAAATARVHLLDATEAELLPDLESFYEVYAVTLGAGPELAVFVTGPSRTADIEKTLVLGAHGPGELHILL